MTQEVALAEILITARKCFVRLHQQGLGTGQAVLPRLHCNFPHVFLVSTFFHACRRSCLFSMPQTRSSCLVPRVRFTRCAKCYSRFGPTRTRVRRAFRSPSASPTFRWGMWSFSRARYISWISLRCTRRKLCIHGVVSVCFKYLIRCAMFALFCC